MENTTHIDINEAKNVQHFSDKDTSKPKSDHDNVQKIEGLTHIDKDKADSDDESVQIINFSMTFSPYKSDLHLEICDELAVLHKGGCEGLGRSKGKIRNFHFKIKENSVDYFYPATRS